MPPDDIGAQVRSRRLALGLTQEQLAAQAHVTKMTVQNIEAGRTKRSYRLPDILRALGLVDPAEERRIRNRLVAGGIPADWAASAARILAADQPPAVPPAKERPA